VPTTRLEAFSDGVLAIAITLLIIDVHVPEAHGNLGHQLGQEWPSFVSYVISFAIIGIIWVNHHALVQHVGAVDRTFLFLNLGLLLTVAWLPFPTAVLARYVRHGHDAKVAAALYGASMMTVGIAFIGLWSHLARTDTVRAPDFSAADARASRRRTFVGPIVYGLSVAVAFVSPVACLAIWAAIAVYFVVPLL